MTFAVKTFRVNALAAVLVAGIIPATSQAEPLDREPLTKHSRIPMGVGALAGAVVGGPFGFVAGTMIGAVIGENSEKTTQLETKEIAMDRATQEIDFLEQQIVQLDLDMGGMEAEVAQLEEALLTRLEFQVLFRTGDDRLRDEDRERIAMLAKYMQRNQDVKVRLQGHTDSRGTEEYNNVLAEYRALAVADALIVRGINSDRLLVESLGASKAIAVPGDYEGYALDRHVNIQVFSENDDIALGNADGESTSQGLALAQ